MSTFSKNTVTMDYIYDMRTGCCLGT